MNSPSIRFHSGFARAVRRVSAILAIALTTSAYAAPIGQFSISVANQTLANNGSISVNSGAKRIFASTLYTYKFSGSIKGEAGTPMGALAPSGTSIAKFVDSLKAGTSSKLSGTFSNPGGTLPVKVIDLHVSGRRPVTGVPGLTSVKIVMDIVGTINATGKCILDVKNVKLVGTPKKKMGSIKFLAGSKLLISAAPEILFKRANISFDENVGIAQIPVRRDVNTHGKVTANYATANGTAGSSDYTPASGSITFEDGETQKFIPVTILDNAVNDAARNFTVNLSNPGGGAVLGSAKSINVTIHDDE